MTQDECASAAKEIGGVNGEKLSGLTGASNDKWSTRIQPHVGTWDHTPCGCFLFENNSDRTSVDIDYKFSNVCTDSARNLGLVCKKQAPADLQRWTFHNKDQSIVNKECKLFIAKILLAWISCLNSHSTSFHLPQQAVNGMETWLFQPLRMIPSPRLTTRIPFLFNL